MKETEGFQITIQEKENLEKACGITDSIPELVLSSSPLLLQLPVTLVRPQAQARDVQQAPELHRHLFAAPQPLLHRLVQHHPGSVVLKPLCTAAVPSGDCSSRGDSSLAVAVDRTTGERLCRPASAPRNI